jgi:hypothetical protein
MNILFDQGTPVPLRRYRHPHRVDTASKRGWSSLRNGDLISQAEAVGYHAFISTDQSLKYQQNLSSRRIRILVLTTTSWPRISKKVALVREELDRLEAGGYAEVAI